MKHRVWFTIALVTVVLSLVLVGTVFSDGLHEQGRNLNRDDPNELFSSGDVDIESLSAVEEFWTDEMIQGAQPLQAHNLSSSEEWIDMQEERIEPRGIPGEFPGEMPDSSITADNISKIATIDLQNEYPQDLDSHQVVLEDLQPLADGYDYPPPFTRYPGNSDWRTHQFYPYTTVGKLFFRIPNTSGNWSCSAAVGQRSAIWTAGHCVYTPQKGWHTDMIFIPAYKDYGFLKEMYGRFAVTEKMTLNGWSQGLSAYDIGMARVADKNGRQIYEYTGYLGFKYNQPAKQHFHIIGYPSNFHDGIFTHICTTSISKRDTKEGPDPIGVGCDMHEGSSGGPWIIDFRPYVSAANNYVNSLVSYGYGSRPLEMFGPYFGDGAKNLWDWGSSTPAQTGTVTGTVKNAVNDNPISGASVCALSVNRCVTTNSQGQYTITNVPIGSQNIKASASGFIALTQSKTIPAGASTTLNFILSPTLAPGEIRIVLTWGSAPRDLDSHLWLPSSNRYHVYFGNRGSCTASPFACLDHDDTTSYGPETITIKQRYNGTYRYAVYQYTSDGSLPSSGARVRVYGPNGLLKDYSIPTSGSGRWWDIFDMDGSTGVITSRNRITTVDPGPYSSPEIEQIK